MYAFYDEDLDPDYIVAFGGGEGNKRIFLINIHDFTVFHDSNNDLGGNYTHTYTCSNQGTAFDSDTKTLYWFSEKEPQLSTMKFNGTFPNVTISVFIKSYKLLYNDDGVLSQASCMVKYGNVLHFVRGPANAATPTNDTYILDFDNIAYSLLGSGNNYALDGNFARLNTARSNPITCAFNEYDDYLYISDSNTNPIERINLSNSSARWESLDMIDLSTLMCGNETYQWVPSAVTAQAGMFINDKVFYLIGGATLTNQIVRIVLDTESDNFTYSCINYTFDSYEVQSAVK